MTLFSSCLNVKCPVHLACFRYRQKVRYGATQTYVLGDPGEDGACSEFLKLRPGDILENVDEEAH